MAFFPCLAAIFLDLLKSAKGEVGAAPCFFWRQALRHIVADALLQMEAQLRIQALFHQTFLE